MNDDVVWSGPRQETPGAGPPVRVVAKTVRTDAATLLGAFFSVNLDCSSRGLPRVVISERPAHGAAVVGKRDAHPAFPAGSPYAACNAGLAPGMGVTYTPLPGYSGADALVIDETTSDGQRQIIRIELSVL